VQYVVSSRYGERDKANISIVGIIITYILFKFLFSFDSDWGILFGIIIVLIIAGLCIAHYVDSLWRSFPALAKSMDSFLDFLSPKDPDEAFTLLKTYAVSGILVLTFSLFGPWFVFEADWRHSFDSYYYDDQHGKLQSSRYGLFEVNYISYEYSDWGDYTTESERVAYEGSTGHQNRQEVASKALNLIISTMGLWIISTLVFLYFISNRLSNTNPRIEKLTKIKRIQEGIVLFSEKLERLKHRGIDITSLGQAVEEIEKSRNSLKFKASVSRPMSVFAYAISGVCIISMGIAVFACLQFGETWAEAMDREDDDGGICGRSSTSTSSTTQCMLVDSFTGYSSDTDRSSSGTYHFNIYWGGGWGRQIILWLGTLTVCGILRNSLALLKLSKTSIQEIATLEKTVNGFSMPNL
tara:strand:+ start:39 stop:1268 length:1230 start_codon:yes stop_codon:yes gene_type:complete